MTYAHDDDPLPGLRAAWLAAIEGLDRARASAVSAAAIERLGVTVFADRIVRQTLDDLGDGWTQGTRSLAEIYMAGRLSTEAIEAHLPPVATGPAPIAISLLDDYHALGKRLVHMSLRVAQLPVIDLGTLAAEPLAERVAESGVGLLFISTLMLRSALRVETLRARLDTLGAPVRIVVGGAPFRFAPELWRDVGAHEMGTTAADAVRIGRAWMEAHP